MATNPQAAANPPQAAATPVYVQATPVYVETTPVYVQTTHVGFIHVDWKTTGPPIKFLGCCLMPLMVCFLKNAGLLNQIFSVLA